MADTAHQGRTERRLAAILAADVAGYSRLMGGDEEGTLAQLKAHRKALVDPKIAEHRGRIVKTTGDGLLVEFASVVDALRCAVEVQRGMAARNNDVPQEKRIEFRVGVHQGDIILDSGDIYGDGVNVAARLEGLAEPGGICVSARVQEDAQGKVELAFEDLGEQRLKNIDRPVRAYRAKLIEATASTRPALPLPDKPSIAVLPFQNMSGDPEQEYFADGVVEDIITALSRFRQLFVIARNSSFTYRGRAVDVKQVGRELGVRYVLEGSVRKSGNRLRITGQLIDASTGAHLWADRFDGAVQDVFDLQDDVTSSVVGAIAPTLERAEIDRVGRKPTHSLDAYDYYLRALASAHQTALNTRGEALELFRKAFEADPNFSAAYAMAAWCYVSRKANGWTVDIKKETEEAERLARRAIQLGREDAIALGAAGYALAYMAADHDAAVEYVDRALRLNPNLATIWSWSGWVRCWRGEPELAIEHLQRAMRLSPVDPFIGNMHAATAWAHFYAGRYEEAHGWAEKAARERPALPAFTALALSSAMTGRLDQAKKAIARALEIDPTRRLSNTPVLYVLRRPEDRAKYIEAARLAGLPE